MNYLNIGLDSLVSAFDICQAHAQLGAEYNVGGWIRGRSSNQHPKSSTGCQLATLRYSDSRRWVAISAKPDDEEDGGDQNVRDIYTEGQCCTLKSQNGIQFFNCFNFSAQGARHKY